MDIYARVNYNKPEQLFDVVNSAFHQGKPRGAALFAAVVCNCVPNPSLVHCVGSGNGKVSWSDWPVGGKYGHPFSLGLSVQSFSVAAALVA